MYTASFNARISRHVLALDTTMINRIIIFKLVLADSMCVITNSILKWKCYAKLGYSLIVISYESHRPNDFWEEQYDIRSDIRIHGGYDISTIYG